MATLGNYGQAYTGKVIDPSQGGAVVDYTPSQPQQNQSITPASLAPQTPITPVVPPETPVPNVSAELQATLDSIDKQYAPLPNEQQYTDIQRKIAQLTGETSDNALKLRTAQLENTPEIIAQQQRVTELTNQLRNIQAQGAAIPQQIQEQFAGRGATTGGIAPIQAGELRKNAISALYTSALLEGERGNLTTALNNIDRAINIEFMQKKQQLEALQANLTMIQNDPASTREEKRRAAQQQAIVADRQKRIAVEEKNKESIQALALQALQNGAPTVIVDQISKATDIFDAMKKATGYASKETAQSIQEYNFYKRQEEAAGRTPVSYNEYQNMDANRKIAIAKAGAAKTSTGLPTNIANQVDKLSSAFDSSPIVKQYNEVQNKKLSVDSILTGGIKGPADLALVYEFMKALDPTSVVRETEYDNAAKSGNIFSGLYAKYNGYLTEGGGFLPDNVRTEFQNIINKKFDVATRQYKNLRDEQARKINMKTGDTDGADYLTNYEMATTVKGSKTDRQFVESAVQASGQDYNQIISLAKQGEIAVVNNSTGEIEFIPVESFSSNYTRL